MAIQIQTAAITFAYDPSNKHQRKAVAIFERELKHLLDAGDLSRCANIEGGGRIEVLPIAWSAGRAPETSTGEG